LKFHTILVVGLALGLSACSSAHSKEAKVSTKQCGGASWYALHGKRTASGVKMNMHAMTAAHKTAKFGSKFQVTNQRNGKSVVVTINDRGPFIKGRVLDLSKGAAGKIGMIGSGHAPICFSKIS
jgi:rare lipoprotein A